MRPNLDLFRRGAIANPLSLGPVWSFSFSPSAPVPVSWCPFGFGLEGPLRLVPPSMIFCVVPLPRLPVSPPPFFCSCFSCLFFFLAAVDIQVFGKLLTPLTLFGLFPPHFPSGFRFRIFCYPIPTFVIFNVPLMFAAAGGVKHLVRLSRSSPNLTLFAPLFLFFLFLGAFLSHLAFHPFFFRWDKNPGSLFYLLSPPFLLSCFCCFPFAIPVSPIGHPLFDAPF